MRPEALASSRGIDLHFDFNDSPEVQVGNVSTTITEEQPKDFTEELPKDSSRPNATCRCSLQ